MAIKTINVDCWVLSVTHIFLLSFARIIVFTNIETQLGGQGYREEVLLVNGVQIMQLILLFRGKWKRWQSARYVLNTFGWFYSK